MDTIVSELYEKNPTRTLYHYTSIGGLQGIVESRGIWATEIRYLNDAKELVQTLDMFLSVIRAKYESIPQAASRIPVCFRQMIRTLLVSPTETCPMSERVLSRH